MKRSLLGKHCGLSEPQVEYFLSACGILPDGVDEGEADYSDEAVYELEDAVIYFHARMKAAARGKFQEVPKPNDIEAAFDDDVGGGEDPEEQHCAAIVANATPTHPMDLAERLMLSPKRMQHLMRVHNISEPPLGETLSASDVAKIEIGEYLQAKADHGDHTMDMLVARCGLSEERVRMVLKNCEVPHAGGVVKAEHLERCLFVLANARGTFERDDLLGITR